MTLAPSSSTPHSAKPKASRLKRTLVRLAYVLGVVVLLLVVGEITARIMGHRPWQEVVQEIQVDPGGRLYDKDPILGYRGRNGTYQLTLRDSLKFTVTHDSLGWRHPKALSDTLPEIWVLGCSFTHGYGVSDGEEYPAQLQQLLPSYRVRNYSMDGFGTLQNWLTLRDQLAAGGRPKAVVLGYGAFHDQRNTANRYWRKALHGQQIADGLRYPFIRLDDRDSLHVHYDSLTYHPLPLQRYLALASLIEENWNRSEDKGLRSRYVTEVLIQRMVRLSKDAGAQFVLAGVYQHPETAHMLEVFHLEGIPTVDISQNLDDPSLRILPGNGHPNPKAHQAMAESLATFLQNKVLHP